LYLAGLVEELSRRADDRRWTYRAVRSVLFKLEDPDFPGEAIGEFLGVLERTFAFAPGCRVACECTVGARTNFRALAYHGIEKIFLPLWSLDDKTLARLKAPHDALAASEALQIALSCGFGAVGVKLLFGVAGQTLSQFRTDLSRLIAHTPEEVVFAPAISTSRFGGRTLSVEQLAKMKAIIEAVMSGLGFFEVQVHRYVRDDGMSASPSASETDDAHTLGLGAGAITLVTDGRGGNVVARNHAATKDYLESMRRRGSAWTSETPRAPEEEIGNAIAQMLYEKSGLDLEALERRFGIDVERVCPGVLDVLVDARYLSRRGPHITLTPVGNVAIDDIVDHFRHGLLLA
jgi:oxygen-independent coproporphyrinogen-3 oxidase